MIRFEDPVTIRLEGYDDVESHLRKQLTYIDKKVDFELKKAKHSRWLVEKLGEEGFVEHLNNLKAQRSKCLLFRDDKGLWTYSGLAARIALTFNEEEVSPLEGYPEPKLMPWAKEPTKKPRSYQLEAEEALLAVRHGGVEIGTGLGKSFALQRLIKHLGLRAVVMAPSLSIATQLHKEMEHHFGRKRVGLYGGGKKDFKKQIVIGIAASLTKVEKGSEAYGYLSQAQVFIADESHLTPAATLQTVCFGLLRNAHYRFFFSGTQMRNDGLDLVLEAITGDIVYRMTVMEGVDQGYLAKPLFTMIRCESDSHYDSRDANAMTRAHLFYNANVNRKAAGIANNAFGILGHQVVILVEEIEQFAHLLPYLRHRVAFAHGGVTKENREKIPEEYWDSDPNKLVDEFNRGELPILVGTSCIATGTDIRSVQHIIMLQGGKSEIAVKQAVGRGTRLVDGKTSCYVTDFDVSNVDVVHRHAMERINIYNDIYGPVNKVG